MVVFNNKTSSETIKEKQITILLDQVDRIFAANGNEPYTNELFTKAQAMTSQLIQIKDKEKVYAEQIKRLNEMMEENTRAVEERIRGVTAELENQLQSARDAQKKAENEAFLEKQNLDAQVANLTKQLEEEKKKTKAIIEKQNLDAQVANLTKQLEEEKKKIEAIIPPLLRLGKPCPIL